MPVISSSPVRPAPVLASSTPETKTDKVAEPSVSPASSLGSTKDVVSPNGGATTPKSTIPTSATTTAQSVAAATAPVAPPPNLTKQPALAATILADPGVATNSAAPSKPLGDVVVATNPVLATVNDTSTASIPAINDSAIGAFTNQASPSASVALTDTTTITKPASPGSVAFSDPAAKTSPGSVAFPDSVAPKTSPESAVFSGPVVPKTSPGSAVFVDPVAPKAFCGSAAFPDPAVSKASSGSVAFSDSAVQKTSPGPAVFSGPVAPQTSSESVVFSGPAVEASPGSVGFSGPAAPKTVLDAIIEPTASFESKSSAFTGAGTSTDPEFSSESAVFSDLGVANTGSGALTGPADDLESVAFPGRPKYKNLVEPNFGLARSGNVAFTEPSTSFGSVPADPVASCNLIRVPTKPIFGSRSAFPTDPAFTNANVCPSTKAGDSLKSVPLSDQSSSVKKQNKSVAFASPTSVKKRVRIRSTFTKIKSKCRHTFKWPRDLPARFKRDKSDWYLDDEPHIPMRSPSDLFVFNAVPRYVESIASDSESSLNSQFSQLSRTVSVMDKVDSCECPSPEEPINPKRQVSCHSIQLSLPSTHISIKGLKPFYPPLSHPELFQQQPAKSPVSSSGNPGNDIPLAPSERMCDKNSQPDANAEFLQLSQLFDIYKNPRSYRAQPLFPVININGDDSQSSSGVQSPSPNKSQDSKRVKSDFPPNAASYLKEAALAIAKFASGLPSHSAEGQQKLQELTKDANEIAHVFQDIACDIEEARIKCKDRAKGFTQLPPADGKETDNTTAKTEVFCHKPCHKPVKASDDKKSHRDIAERHGTDSSSTNAPKAKRTSEIVPYFLVQPHSSHDEDSVRRPAHRVMVSRHFFESENALLRKQSISRSDFMNIKEPLRQLCHNLMENRGEMVANHGWLHAKRATSDTIMNPLPIHSLLIEQQVISLAKAFQGSPWELTGLAMLRFLSSYFDAAKYTAFELQVLSQMFNGKEFKHRTLLKQIEKFVEISDFLVYELETFCNEAEARTFITSDF